MGHVASQVDELKVGSEFGSEGAFPIEITLKMLKSN